jgi:hypothetical protein
MGIAWSTVQDALSAWVAESSGLNAAKFEYDEGHGFDSGDFGDSPVLWVNQPAPQPRLPYATLKLSPLRRLGGNVIPISYIFDPLQPNGKELLYTATGQNEITCTVEVFSDIVTGAGTAMEFLENALAALMLPGVYGTLQLAGLALVAWSPPLDLSVLIATGYQSRASSDVRFYIVDTASERQGYITEMDVGVEVDNVTYPPAVIEVT